MSGDTVRFCRLSRRVVLVVAGAVVGVRRKVEGLALVREELADAVADGEGHLAVVRDEDAVGTGEPTQEPALGRVGEQDEVVPIVVGSEQRRGVVERVAGEDGFGQGLVDLRGEARQRIGHRLQEPLRARGPEGPLRGQQRRRGVGDRCLHAAHDGQVDGAVGRLQLLIGRGLGGDGSRTSDHPTRRRRRHERVAMLRDHRDQPRRPRPERAEHVVGLAEVRPRRRRGRWPPRSVARSGSSRGRRGSSPPPGSARCARGRRPEPGRPRPGRRARHTVRTSRRTRVRILLGLRS